MAAKDDDKLAHDPKETKEAVKNVTSESKQADQLDAAGLQLNRGAGTPHGEDVHYPADHETWNRRTGGYEPTSQAREGEALQAEEDERQRERIRQMQEDANRD